MSADKVFRPLASMLRSNDSSLEMVDECVEASFECGVPCRNASAHDDITVEVNQLMRDVRLFRARLSDLLDDSVAQLRADIAAEVLARELQLSPADIASIARRVVARFLDEEPVRLRLHPGEADAVHCDIPVVGDETLRLGDAILELRNGSVDASLGVRLEGVLSACT